MDDEPDFDPNAEKDHEQQQRQLVKNLGELTKQQLEELRTRATSPFPKGVIGVAVPHEPRVSIRKIKNGYVAMYELKYATVEEFAATAEAIGEAVAKILKSLDEQFEKRKKEFDSMTGGGPLAT